MERTTNYMNRVWKAIPWIRDMTKIQCVIRKTLNGIRNLTTTRDVGSQNVGTWCRALGENSSNLHNRRFMSRARRTRHFCAKRETRGKFGKRDSRKKKERRENVRMRECGIRTSLSRPYLKQVLLTYKDTNQNPEKNVQPVNVDKRRK